MQFFKYVNVCIMTEVQEIDILVRGLNINLHDIFINTLLNEVEILNNLSICIIVLKLIIN